MDGGPTVCERIARTLAGIWLVLYGAAYVTVPPPLSFLVGFGCLGSIGLIAMGLAVAGTGLVALATRHLLDRPRRTQSLVSYAGAAAGTITFVAWAVHRI